MWVLHKYNMFLRFFKFSAENLKFSFTQITCSCGANSKKHSAFELRIIGTNAQLVDSYFHYLTMHT